MSLPYVKTNIEQVRAKMRAYAPGQIDVPPPEGWVWINHPGFVFNRPQIVTLCGSTQFVEEFNKYRQKFTLMGLIVLSIEIVTTQQASEDPQHVNRPNKEMLDALHLEKIKLSDFIFVINKGYYIGESTRAEIAFAHNTDVPVSYMIEGFTGNHAAYVSPSGKLTDPLA